MASARYDLSSGTAGLLKDGTKHLTALEGVIIKNIEACSELGKLTRTSLGPNGMNKLIVNHLEKIFVTSDAATIITQMEVVHPAANMIVLAAKMQESEFGDATNFVVAFASELLLKSLDLLMMGLHASDIITGYRRAAELACKSLESLAVETMPIPPAKQDLERAVRSATGSKFYDYRDLLSELVASACEYALSVSVNSEERAKVSLNVDNVRVVKIPGGSVHQSRVVKGMVLTRPAMGTITKVEKAGVAVFGANVEAAQTETKGTVLISNASELLSYTGTEEDRLEEQIRGVRESGVDVIVSGGSVSEMALHFIEKYKMMCVKVTSKFELQRVCRATGAFPVMRLGPLSPDERGTCDLVETRELGGQPCIVFENSDSKLATILLRSSTANQLEDLERAVDDGIQTVKTLCADPRMLAGAGATEMELAGIVAALGESSKGLEQYPILKYAEALEVVPRTLAENSGLEPNQAVSRLYALHKAKGLKAAGVDVEHELTGSGGVAEDVVKSGGVLDPLATKLQALKLASDAVVTILSIDQLIMSKQAGGPKLPANNPGGNDE